MKKNIIWLFSALLSLSVILFACEQQEVLDPNSTATTVTTTTTTAGFRSGGMSKAAYLQLSEEDKKTFWLDKMDFILSQSLTTAQIQIINQIKASITSQSVGKFEFTTQMELAATEGINVFSEMDYINTFGTADYNTIQGNDGTHCTNCLVTTGTGPAAGLPDCNCRWTCGDNGSGSSCSSTTSSNCCNRTLSGCGFLFLGTCDGHDSL